MTNSRPADLVERLQHVEPFDSLPEASLVELCDTAMVHSLDTGDRIAEVDEMLIEPSLYVVLSGRVRLVEAEQQMTVRHLRAGEIFGHFALLRGLPTPYNAEISMAGKILEIQKKTLVTIFDRHPVFAAWFRADLRRFERELGAFDDVAGSHFLFGQRLVELDHAAVPVCEPTTSIIDVAKLMAKHDSDYVIIKDGEDAVGLVSDADLRSRVVAVNLPLKQPIASIMQPDPLSIRGRASVFDGMMAMEQRNRRHLVLLDDAGVLQGVIGDTDLARVLLNSPTALRRRIGQVETAEELCDLRAAADRMIVTLYRRGVRAEDLLQINTRFNDALAVRILKLVMSRLSDLPAGVRWCWLALGSEGRGEMGLRTDQDNAIIYFCETPDSVEAADRWLAQLANETNTMLDRAGIALCSGGIMANQATMRHDLEGWCEAVNQWMSDADDIRMLWISALTDCRPIYGDAKLCSELKNSLLQILGKRRQYLRLLAREAMVPELPLRHFPRLRLKGFTAAQGKSLHLKNHGTHLVTHAARLLCLDAGWMALSNTGERLAWLRDTQPQLNDIAQEAIVAYGLLADVRLSWHVEQLSRGEELSEHMPLSKFGETRQRLLIGAYQTVEDIRSVIRIRFGISR